MSTTTARPTAAHRASATVSATLPPTRPSLPPAAGHPAAVRTFLTGFAGTLLPLLTAVVGLELAWQLLAGSTWPAAGAVVTGWALAGAWWMYRRGWQIGSVMAATAAPVALLAGPAALGWLSPAGLVLWGPVSTVLAAALGMAAQPLASEPPDLG
jgi:hypothetical protein